MAQATLEEVQALAEQLSSADKARLVRYLNIQITLLASGPAITESPSTMTPEEAQIAWKQLRESMRHLPTPRLSLAEQLERDRAERDRAISGE